MKRAFAILLALVMVFSLSVTAFAAEETGSITITNATIGQTYNLFKIFDATYAVDADGNTLEDSNGDAVVSYTITTDNQFFEAMFGKDGTATNEYFIYEATTGVVTKRAGVIDTSLYAYLDDLASKATPDQSITAESATVVFDEEVYTGYYLIDRGIASTITLTSNMPNVKVIDKNQKPNDGDTFSKLVWDEDFRGEGQETRQDENGNTLTGKWDKSSSANVGDIIDWQITFNTTNYDGEDVVMYYAIRDIKSSSLWIEFDTINIKVGDKTLTKGYYHCANDTIDTDEWNFLGTGWGVDADGKPTGDPNDAEWYLIHYGYDEIEIVIPWMDDFTFTGVQSASKGYELTFDFDEEDGNEILSESIYPSPSIVTMNYSAAVGPEAAGTTANNSATLDWVTVEGPFGPDTPQTTETKVYNLGITKIANDGNATTQHTRLAGAVFELYRNYNAETNTYSDPVYVIPTNNAGVYILDDINTEISGKNKVYSRDVYKGYWEAYIGEDVTNMRNDVVTPANGQVVVLGLEAGPYYLKETKAPEGYNQLSTAVPVIVGEGTTATFDNGYKALDGSDVKYSVYNQTVQNNRGVELPSTGGQGTMMLITFGTMIAIAFAVLMITQKKMTAYRD